MTQKCDLQEISQHVTVKGIYTFFFQTTNAKELR